MLAAVYKGIGSIDIEEVDRPEIHDDEYLVEVLCSGLCGTDIKTYKQGHRMFTPPCVLGHEFCGTIVAAGKDVDASLVGKKMTCAPYVGCGHCDNCRNGLEELCVNKIGTDGAFTQYLVVSKELANKGMFVFDDEMDIHEMTMAEPFACILNSIRKSNVKMGQNVLIMGGGPMGLIHVAALKHMGANKIIVSEFNPKRRDVAVSMGADVINPSEENVNEAIQKLTNGAGVDHIIVCVGLPEVVEEAMNYTKNGTVINIFGGLKSGSTITIDPNIIHYNAVSIVGSFGFTSNDFKMAAQLLASKKVSLAKMITNVYALKDVKDAFANATNPEVIKSLVEMK